MVSYLKEYITKSGFKQSYIAAKIGISENALTAYITGRRNPKSKTKEKLANILNCKIEDIFFAKNNYNVEKQVDTNNQKI